MQTKAEMTVGPLLSPQLVVIRELFLNLAKRETGREKPADFWSLIEWSRIER
jgi:hypothetical protein